MPVRKPRLTRTEETQFRASLSYLKQMGIGKGSVEEQSVPDPERYTLEQIDYEFARVHDLNDGDVAVVIPAKLIVRKPGFMITDAYLVPSWFDWKIDLDNLENNEAIVREITQGLPIFPPTILNREFVGRTVPQRPCQIQGVIIGTGYSPFPAKFHDETTVTVWLVLEDERDNLFSHEFTVRVDRSVMRARKRRREFYAPVKSTKSSGLYDKVEPDAQIKFPEEVPKKPAKRN